jgi:transcriptional regulator with XRE-family HTH domain
VPKTKTTEVFRDRLNLLIQESGKSVVELSKEMHISRSNLWKYQNNTAEASISSLVIIADYFDVSTDYLLGLSDDRVMKAIGVKDLLGLSDKSLSILSEAKAGLDQLIELASYTKIDLGRMYRILYKEDKESAENLNKSEAIVLMVDQLIQSKLVRQASIDFLGYLYTSWDDNSTSRWNEFVQSVKNDPLFNFLGLDENMSPEENIEVLTQARHALQRQKLEAAFSDFLDETNIDMLASFIQDSGYVGGESNGEYHEADK